MKKIAGILALTAALACAMLGSTASATHDPNDDCHWVSEHRICQ